MRYERPSVERRVIRGLLATPSDGVCPPGYEYDAFNKVCNLIEF